jgi:predicted HTH transcriptional regulator
MTALQGRARPKRAPRAPRYSGDGRTLDGFDLDDLDEASLKEYRYLFAATKPKHPWLALDDEALLEQLGCWSRHRETGQYGVTLAGLLMFGRYDAIASPGAVPTYHVDFRDYGGREGHTWSDRLFPDGTWEANLFQFFQLSWPKLTSSLRVPRGSNAIAQPDATPVHMALREAVVNALVHTDYGTPGGIVFERRQERFLLENPGTLSDQAGAGYQRIRDGWRSQLWPEPTLVTQEKPDRVRLEFIMRSAFAEQLLVTIAEKAAPRSRSQPWLR